MTIRVEIKALQKTLSNKNILSNINLEINSYEICALIGPNGAGKTSLIKCLLGLLQPDFGSININNIELSSHSRANILKEIGVVLQFPENLGKFKIQQVISEHLYYHRIQEAEVIEELLKNVELIVSPNGLVKNLSLGMKQRLMLCLALAHKPSILILDEPFNGLDVDGIKLIKKIIKDFTNKGNSVIVTSHSLSELQDLATSVVFMKGGKTMKKQDMHVINHDFKNGLIQFYDVMKNEKREE